MSDPSDLSDVDPSNRETLGKASAAIAAGAVLVGLIGTLLVQFAIQSANQSAIALLNTIFFVTVVLAQLVALALGLVAARDTQSCRLWAGIGIGLSAAILVSKALTHLGVWMVWSYY